MNDNGHNNDHNDEMKRNKNFWNDFNDKHYDPDLDLFETDVEVDAEVDDDVNEEEELQPSKWAKWIKVGIASIVAIAMLTNILAFWPHVYSLAAIQFIRQSAALSAMDEVQTIKEAVVVIKAGDRKGTGFFIAEDGWIITNEHVVEDEQEVSVGFYDGQHGMATVIAADPELDIALLKTEVEGTWPALPFEQDNLPSMEAESMMEAVEVVFVGNPLFFSRIANEGVAYVSVPQNEHSIPLFVIQAPIFKGHSGSPLLNKEGNVIGIVFATTEAKIDGQTEKVGLAVPISYIDTFISYFLQ